jgi:hypothetical protein
MLLNISKVQDNHKIPQKFLKGSQKLFGEKLLKLFLLALKNCVPDR